MKSFISKFLIVAFGITLATAPLAANAAEWAVGVNVGGPGYDVHAGYVNPRPAPPPPPRYGWHHQGYAQAYSEGYYGRAPGGYYGYYSHGRWFGHRRWGNGFWIYF